MFLPCPNGSCYYFVDYLNICSIAVYEDVVCMHGVYKEPVRGKIIPAYFEADFDFFYDLLSSIEFITNADKGIEALSKSLAVANEEESTIELDLDSIVELHTMVIRLISLSNEESRTGTKRVDLLIEDAFPMPHGHYSFYRYLEPPELGEDIDRGVRVNLLRAFRDMSGHIASLALRYEYYLHRLRKGVSHDNALAISSLEDKGVFEAARAAHRLIVGMKEEFLVY